MSFRTRIRKHAGAIALALFASVLFVAGAGAQGSGGPPGIDHYKVYRAQIPVPSPIFPVFLRDQFHAGPRVARELAYFATPAVKDGFPLFDPVLHYDWWRIEPIPFTAMVLTTNQFGAEQVLRLKRSEFLLNPSVKFPQPGQALPLANHYECYSVDGPSPARLVSVQDQFGFNHAFVDSARFFCNPVDKEDATGFHPILRPEAHLTCYDIVKTPPTPILTVVVQDQFGFWQVVLVEDEFLCVPSYKTGVTPAEHKTWGEIKATYR